MVLPESDLVEKKIDDKTPFDGSNITLDLPFRLYQEGKYQEALEKFKALLGAANASLYNIDFFIGNCYYQLDQKDAAEKHWLAALNRPGKLGKIYLNLGNLDFGREDIEKAILVWHKSLLYEPESMTCNYN